MNAYKAQGPNLTWERVLKAQMRGERMMLFINGHPYTGDHILCAGMYRVLAQKWMLNIFTRHGLHDTVCRLVQGVPDVSTTEIDEREMDAYADSLRDAMVLRLGDHLDPKFDHNDFDIGWYRQAGVDFRHRWDSFKAPVIEQLPVPQHDYIFIHDRPEKNGAKLDIEGERPRPGADIFAHRDLILNAKELHCVSSAYAAFADSFDLTGKGLFFHAFGREIPTHKNKWVYK